MATLGNLPEEVMIDILSRLPRDSLLRFKSVSKSWYALINGHSLQFKHVLLKPFVTMDSGNDANIFSILKFPLSLDRPVSVVDVDFPFYDVDLPIHEDLEFHGHSHGLVCLTDRIDIFLSNPTTGELRKLPPSILPLAKHPREPDFYYPKPVGFGYDEKSRDFKVVRVVDFYDEFDTYDHKRVEIYDLSKDRWREIETPIYSHVFWMPSFEMYHQGIYYWWAYNDESMEIIQSFDMSEEVFGEILVPESFEELWGMHRSMGVLNGSIVLFHYPSEGDEKSFDIWEMEEDESGDVSWSHILTIGPVSGIDKPLLFVSSEELLMEANEGQVILYNIKTLQIKTQPIETQKIKELPIQGHPNKFEATFFVESLRSMKGGSNLISYGV